MRTTSGLQTVRAAYGAALVLAPGPAIRLATRRLPSRRTCRVARVLGTRHLIQAVLTAAALEPRVLAASEPRVLAASEPRVLAASEPRVLAAGGQVDAVHTASMLLLAAVSRAGRRAALTDALTEAAFAAAGFCLAVNGR